MTKQHQLLAVEPTRSSAADRQLAERKATWKNKVANYGGKTRKLELFGRNEDANRVEYAAIEAKDAINTPVQDTIPADLNYMAGVVGQWYDIVLQKEQTNQIATADVKIDGTVIISKAPATFLLGLESKLKQLREVYEQIPTLAPGIVWEEAPDVGLNTFKSPVDTDIKTATTKSWVQQKQSSDKHPDTFSEQSVIKNIGTYTAQNFSGLISVARKAAILARLDKFLMAIKTARQEANEAEASQNRCAEKIFEYLHGDMHNVEAMRKAADGVVT